MDPSALDGETAHEKGPSVPLERVGLIGGGLAETAVRGVCICTFLYVLPVECGYESARCMCHSGVPNDLWMDFLPEGSVRGTARTAGCAPAAAARR